MTIAGNGLSGQGFDIEGEDVFLKIDDETIFDYPFKMTDLGDNRCGFPDATEACQLVSAGLQPPDPIDPPVGP